MELPLWCLQFACSSVARNIWSASRIIGTTKRAAAYPVQTITAWYGLMNLGNLEEGQGVLIHSVAGGVGLQALKIAKAFNVYHRYSWK